MCRGTQFALGDTGRPEDRVVRIVNLHYEADSDDVHDFFGDDYTIIDFIRAVNTKSNKYTIGYVLFATEQERINAQTLSGQHLLDREIKVMPAQSGFRVSTSGDKLSPAYSDEDIEVADVDDAEQYVPPAPGDIEAFPSLAKAATPILAAGAPVLASSRKQPAQQRALQNRLLFMNNVGQDPEVNYTSFSLFFGGYTVVDVKRSLDPETRTPHPTAFVMLASAEERDEALYTLKGVPMQGRKVTLEVPKIFQHVDENGFMPSFNEDVTFSPSPLQAGTTVVIQPASAPGKLNKYLQRLQQTSEHLPEKSYLPKSSSSSGNDVRTLLDQLGQGHDSLQQVSSTLRAGLDQQTKPNPQAECKRLVGNSKIKWGLSRDELSKCYIDKLRTLLPMPSGVEGPGQMITGPPKTPQVVSCSPSAQPHLGVPSGVDTSFRPREYGWNLSGNQDQAHQVIPEEDWYGAIEQRWNLKK